ncbi:MAG: hypothetical protein IK032_02450 [Bacteroidales bacterium]|nr:hypothetical protein [Bacteroidales bacterium]
MKKQILKIGLPLLVAVLALTACTKEDNDVPPKDCFGFVPTGSDSRYIRVADSNCIPKDIRESFLCTKWRDNEYSVSKKQLPYISGIEYISLFYYYIGDDTPILPRISFKMSTNAFSIDAIARKYDVTLESLGNGDYVLHCNVFTSQEVLRILEMVSKLEGVEWFVPEYYPSILLTD